MHTKIAEFLRSRKGRDALLVFIVVLLAVISFLLGRLSVESQEAAPVVLYVPEQLSRSATESRATDDYISSGDGEANGRYVASKNGQVYHLPWCAGAQRIKEENKVWYDTKEAAEVAGLRPAVNCKGL